MNEKFEPDQRFVDRLEWQLQTEHRRADRLRTQARRLSFSRRAVMAAGLVGVLLFGVTVIKAAEMIQDSWRKKIEIARAETEVQLKKAGLDFNREIASQMEKRFALGLVGREDRMAGGRAAERAEAEWKRALINLDEVKASGEAPRGELYAPKADGRDFVGERLEIDLREAEAELKLVEAIAKATRERFNLGLVQAEDLHHFESEVTVRKEAMAEIRGRLALRKRFLKGGLTAQDVEIQGRLTAAAANANSLQAKVEALQERMTRLSRLESLGLVTAAEARGQQAALEAAKAEMRLAALEKDILEKAR
jgi:hypothetical protein